MFMKTTSPLSPGRGVGCEVQMYAGKVTGFVEKPGHFYPDDYYDDKPVFFPGGIVGKHRCIYYCILSSSRTGKTYTAIFCITAALGNEFIVFPSAAFRSVEQR